MLRAILLACLLAGCGSNNPASRAVASAPGGWPGGMSGRMSVPQAGPAGLPGGPFGGSGGVTVRLGGPMAGFGGLPGRLGGPPAHLGGYLAPGAGLVGGTFPQWGGQSPLWPPSVVPADPTGGVTTAPSPTVPLVDPGARVASGVNDLLKDIKAKAEHVGRPGGMSPDEFHAYMLDMQTRLDSLKKLMDALEGAVRGHHRP